MSFAQVYENVIAPVKWTGPEPTWSQTYLVHNLAVIGVGTLWAFVFKFAFIVVEFLSAKFFKRYQSLNAIQRVDWTSRIVAMGFIFASSWMAVEILMGKTNHRLEAVFPSMVFENSEWRFTTNLHHDSLYLLFHYYCVAFGYELYDLKNCYDIRMYSGVLHHIVLLVIFPLAWSASTMSILAAAMVSSTYLSNIPAHFRSFMVILGYRDSKAYKINKWVWWLSYVVFRLFGIPWFSAIMWFCIEATRLQVPTFALAWYYSAMVCHYALSLYWFVEMTKTMFPPDKQMKRVGSFPIFPQDAKKAEEKIAAASNPRNRRSGASADSSDDEGGQKFD